VWIAEIAHGNHFKTVNERIIEHPVSIVKPYNTDQWQTGHMGIWAMPGGPLGWNRNGPLGWIKIP